MAYPSETLGMCMLQLLPPFVVKHRNINEWSTHCLMLLILGIVAVEAFSKAVKATTRNQLVSSYYLSPTSEIHSVTGVIINPIYSTCPVHLTEGIRFPSSLLSQSVVL